VPVDHPDHQQEAFAHWGEFFNDDNVAMPIVDRIIYHLHIFMLGGENYRLKTKLNQSSYPRKSDSILMAETGSVLLVIETVLSLTSECSFYSGSPVCGE